MLRASLVLALGFACPAVAADVTFTGTVSNTCTLTVATPGVMALSSSGTILGSNQTGGVAATLNILSLGTNEITVGAPTVTGSPAGYLPTGQQASVSYQGLAGLAGTSQALTTAASNFNITILPLTSLLIHNQITNSNGFAVGNYETTTVVTCS